MWGLRMGLGGVWRPSSGSAGSAPTNSVAPAISGTQTVGSLLSTTDGTWTGSPSFTYQWKRDGSSIGSATANTYTLVELDAGADMICVVTGTNGAGNASATSNTLTTDVYVVFLTHIEDGTDGTTFSGGSWDAVNFGTAAANRKIAVGLSGRSASALVNWSSGSIGGNASAVAGAAFAVNTTSGGNFAGLTIADVTTGTSGNLSNTFSQTVVRIGAGVWAIYGANSSTPSANDQSTVNTAPTATETIPAGGSAIGCSYGGAGTTSTATGLVEDYDASVEAGAAASTGAHLNSHAGGSTVMTFTWTAGGNNSGAFASWGP